MGKTSIGCADEFLNELLSAYEPRVGRAPEASDDPVELTEQQEQALLDRMQGLLNDERGEIAREVVGRLR